MWHSDASIKLSKEEAAATKKAKVKSRKLIRIEQKTEERQQQRESRFEDTDLDDLNDDYRLLRKLKRRKITKDRFDEQFFKTL